MTDVRERELEELEKTGGPVTHCHRGLTVITESCVALCGASFKDTTHMSFKVPNNPCPACVEAITLGVGGCHCASVWRRPPQ